ncbi:MAG: serine/threonine-protein phosphatase [Oscillibacter sp.]|nr:serine/threonine-protein phosphatase [Oscillibacter sp.]MBQ9618295.1 serine/threonine-protein phosphatase [Oscillibacter sp.]
MKLDFLRAVERAEGLCRDAVRRVANLRYPLEAALLSETGLRRPNNEDNFLLNREINETSGPSAEIQEVRLRKSAWHCCAVFDGMGGGEFGELAALLSARAFRDFPPRGGLSPGDVQRLAREAFQNANRAVLEQKLDGMYGSTGTALYTDGRLFKIFHLGDSRAYLFRDGTLTRLTKDQTLAAVKAEDGIYAPGDPLYEQEKRLLWAYIGCDVSMKALKPLETPWEEIRPGDVVLLCSDGLYDMCGDAEISEILRASGNAWDAVRRLTDAAKQNGGEDNITCLAIRHLAGGARDGKERGSL